MSKLKSFESLYNFRLY